MDNFNSTELTNWMTDIRNNLLSLNLFNSNNTGTYYMNSARELTTNSVDSTNIAVAASQVALNTLSSAITQQQANNELIATEIIAENIASQLLLDAAYQNDLTKIQNKYNTLANIKNLEKSAAQYPTNADNQLGLGEQFSQALPIQGIPYDNESAAITNAYLSKTNGFAVITGSPTFTEADGTITRKSNELLFRSWVKQKTDGTLIANPDKTFTPSTPYSSYITDFIKRNETTATPVGSYKFFIEKLHGRDAVGNPNRKNKIKSTKDKKEIPTELSNRMVFAAYINNFGSSTTLEKSEYNFSGRGDSVPVYRTTRRNMTLEFSILADYSAEFMVALQSVYQQAQLITPSNIDNQLNEIVKNFPDWGMGTYSIPTYSSDGKLNVLGDHIPGMYSDTPESLLFKMNFLEQCCYPYYRSDGKMKEQPMVRIRIADFYDITGMITSINYDLNELEGIQIDMNPSNVGNVPLAIRITMNVDIYADYEPNSNYFGFFHRKEFDNGTIDPVTGAGLANKKLDIIRENIKKNSPAEITNIVKNEGLLETPSILGDYKKPLSKEISNLANSVNDLQNVGMKLTDALLASKTKKAMQAYMRLQNIINAIKIEQGQAEQSMNPTTGVNNFGTNIINNVKGNNVINLSTNPLQNISNATNTSNTQFNENYTNLMNTATQTINKTSDALSNLNNSTLNSGLQTEVKSLNDLQNDVNSAKLLKTKVKTIQDIIDQINAKQGPQQNKNV